ncbi:gp18 [Aeromonas phage 31]|uniref:Gp18 n=1 Tax=Aeromonas phage 31 TaxID=321023 RepID=Q56EK9_9CAUD|nr:tail sheath [Aeromonas phage 31]AAX63641.1 gp18 [Aeromonas phage 31]APU01046.1 tail sheath monomer [Aeromonas phage 31.2]
MALLSPGIEMKETSINSTVVRSATGRAAIVGKFAWGPAYEVRQVTNEVELVDMFGSPDNVTAPYFMSAMNFLQYGNDLRLVRVIDMEKAKNASPLVNQVSVTITTEGQGYTVGDAITVKYNNATITEAGKVTAVDSDGKIKSLFVPTAEIIAKTRQLGTYPTLGDNWRIDVSGASGGSAAALALGNIVVDSGVTFGNSEDAPAVMTSPAVMEKYAKFGMPLISAVYPGEIGSTVEVEIVSKTAFNSGAQQTIYPFGGTRTSNARGVIQYGPMTDDQFAIIVRRDGIVVESTVLSTRKGDRDVYGSNIFMDDYFRNGGSNFIFASSEGWPAGFTGIIQLGGGTSANADVGADELIKGWDLFSDREALHVNLMIAGACGSDGAEIASTVQKYVVSLADDRQDCVAIVNPPAELMVGIPTSTAVKNIVEWRNGMTGSGEVVDNNMNISSTYAFIIGNYKYQYDKYNDINRWVPLAADIAGLCAYTDQVSHPWMSPAGYRRGQIRNCIKLAIEPKQSMRDTMYQVAINPVTGFAGGDGFVLFGDKMATQVPSPFDRINVRRLFNMLKKNIGDTSKYELFENNDAFTRQSFRMETSQYLDGIRSLGGCYDFRVVCDTTNNTPNVIDRNEFVGTIYVKPPRSINYITLNMVATSTGANFDELIGPMQLA